MVEEDGPDLSMTAPADHDWRLRDRLSPADIHQLVESFKHRTTIPELAIRYGISRSSVKTLLRQRGARRLVRDDWRHDLGKVHIDVVGAVTATTLLGVIAGLELPAQIRPDSARPAETVAGDRDGQLA